MPFFSSDLGLSQEFADPKVQRVFQPQIPTSMFSGTRSVNQQDPLSQLARAISGSGSGYTGAQFGGQGGTTLPEISPGMPSFPMPGIPQTPAPIVGDPGNSTFPGMPSAGQNGGDGGITDTTTIDSYQSLQDYLNASPMERGIATGLLSMMGIPFAGSLQQLGYGINPLYGTTIGGLFGQNVEGKQTIDGVYKGATDYFGNPISDAQAATASGGMFSGFGSQYEADVAEMYGWGSPEHFDAIESQFGRTTPEPTTVESVVSQAPAPVDISSQWETTPGSEQSQMLAEQEAGMDTTTAGGYTWSDSDWGSVAEAQEDTGIGTSEWDSSAEGFSWDDSGDSGDSGGGDSGGGGSYIATAATQALGEEGLKVFEDWRDYMFKVLPTFKSSFGRYRATAPKIVAEIDNKDNSKNIYSWIWDMHLKPIFDMIKEDKDSKKALKDYKVMVRELSNKFLSKEK
jgi:hypothetical protein